MRFESIGSAPLPQQMKVPSLISIEQEEAEVEMVWEGQG